MAFDVIFKCTDFIYVSTFRVSQFYILLPFSFLRVIIYNTTKVFYMETGVLMEYRTHSPEETEALGEKFSCFLKPGDAVTFSGGLGAGKTAFARGVLRGLGYKGRVTSPTFAIANEYDTPSGRVAHIDLYRITTGEALEEIGFEEYFNGGYIVLVEWSENAFGFLPESCKNVNISYGEGTNERVFSIEGGSI